jgi:mannose-6-phosphate isomerase-like protein (cupin superfamily)
MTDMPTAPIDLFASVIQLQDDRHAAAAKFDATQDNWQLMTMRAETESDVHADYWEMHPDGEELVACLSGGMRLYLRCDQTGEEEVTLAAGAAVIVPRGRWHRIELDAPSDLMAVTVCQNTRLESRTKP